MIVTVFSLEYDLFTQFWEKKKKICSWPKVVTDEKTKLLLVNLSNKLSLLCVCVSYWCQTCDRA